MQLSAENKVLLLIVGGTLAVLVAAVFFLTKNSSVGNQEVLSSSVVEIDYSKGQKIGSDSAKVKLVEFSDLQCPSCAAAHPVVKALLDQNLDNFQYIYRHFPLAQHRNGESAANFAEYGASKGKFIEAVDKLFDTQVEWENLSDPSEYFGKLAGELGIDTAEAQSAVKNKSYAEFYKADIAEGNKLGVNSTPTFFLNGKKLNLPSFSQLSNVVKEELNK